MCPSGYQYSSTHLIDDNGEILPLTFAKATSGRKSSHFSNSEEGFGLGRGGRDIVSRSLERDFTNGQGVLHEYGHIAILVIIALVFPAGAIIQSWAFKFVNIRPEVPSDPVKEDTYECGMVTRGPALTQFNFRFYYIALLFLLLDVEIVFLFPWAVVLESAGLVGLGKIAIFVGTFVVGGLYAWRKRALEWN
ncbi:MAG: hypothetical protein CL897_03570 [Dehalococcoidia bacterium]|nr:hypothetical protein [Dehalococcoidia bacterium]HCR19159.1 hypothetical protein [Candidatus Latescibacterota bacterium]HCU99760.1 hypothetical protein [Dehalococcoidia bacterium]